METSCEKMTVRDYTKPIILNFKGREGHEAYIKIVTTPPAQYDAEQAAEKAKENLKKQGLEIR